MLRNLRRRLGFKLFLSYLAVILAGLLVQALVVEAVIPSAFERHMAGMSEHMGGMMEQPRRGGPPVDGGRGWVYLSFRSGVNEALAAAGLVSLLAALAVSVLVTRRLVAPVQAMTEASLAIADGHFERRVAAPPGDPAEADELGQLARAFNQMAERLEHTEEMRRQLLGDVSHELRTPLTAIKGSMEALVDGVLPAEAATFQQIEQEADRLQRLVNDLQELSRVEGGAYELNRRLLSVEALAQAAVGRMRTQFQQKGVALGVEVEPGLPPIQGDEDRLLQVLLNLLDNACRYTPPGGQVQLTAGRQGREVHLAVRDNGIGIPAEHLPHLFTRFYRVDKSRSRREGGGSGIGLAIARHLVEAHGGRIWAESAGPGQGSTFWVALPLP